PRTRRRPRGTVDVLRMPVGTGDVVFVAVGPFAEVALETAARLEQQGIRAAVVDPRWVLPVPEALVALAGDFRMVVTVEDSGLHGGIGSSVSAALRRAGVDTPSRDVGVPQRFLDHASRDQILKELGLTAQDLARQITGWVVGIRSEVAESSDLGTAGPGVG
ncbi:transketolase C-terminal domain-containing protein, partial [Rhodococcus sp. NPDC058514]|uniref:transketolase C-terminal domain-containing protein n=1 Tax=Rhodococcus sp. NPDC058514 TaxID=3346532 RepID=UPI003662AB3D